MESNLKFKDIGTAHVFDVTVEDKTYRFRVDIKLNQGINGKEYPYVVLIDYVTNYTGIGGAGNSNRILTRVYAATYKGVRGLVFESKRNAKRIFTENFTEIMHRVLTNR
jgi:hypothetical protein